MSAISSITEMNWGMNRLGGGALAAPLILALGAIAIFGKTYQKNEDKQDKQYKAGDLYTEELARKPKISWEEIQKHKTPTDCYVVVDNCVLNVSEIITKLHHPGANQIFLSNAGTDMTKQFYERTHSPHEMKYIRTQVVGLI